MFMLKYLSIVLCVNVKLYSCLSENEDGLYDILNSTTQATEASEETQSTFLVPDDGWLVTALKDIAYFLRNHKFNEWDRRFYTELPKHIDAGFYVAFPDPTLKAIHWKVYENCYKDFFQCVKYLYSIIETAPFTRNDDITTTLNKQMNISDVSVAKLDNYCKQAQLYTEKTGLPFDAPNEKFQWRTSASYYMCWYTMLGIPALSMLGESCDNFANCLDLRFGSRNHDPRSDDKLSFACAMYSFCPDPCCPLKHVVTMSQCHNNPKNPCYKENAASQNLLHRQCQFDRKDNQNFENIIANKWNVSCYCQEKGFEWKSQFGMCVDTNECVGRDKHKCDLKTESCFNLPGTYKCICKSGYVYNFVKKKCIKSFVPTPYSNTSKKEENVGFLDYFESFLKYLGF